MIVFYSMFRKKKRVIMHGVSVRTFSTRMYKKLWEHVVKTDFFNNEIWVQ